MKKIFTKLKSILIKLLSILFGFRLRFTIYRLKEENQIMMSLSFKMRERKDVMYNDSKSNSVSTNEGNEET